MKRLIGVTLLVLLFAVVGLTPKGSLAGNGSGSVTGAAHGLFTDGAALGTVALESLDIGTGVFVEPDGSADGVFQAVLSGPQVLGQARQITIEGRVNDGTMSPDGRA